MSKFDKRVKKLPAYIKAKCFEKIEAATQGASWAELDAKKVECCSDLFSVRLNIDYRLLLRLTTCGLVPEWVGSHQQYDKKLP